MEEKEEPPDAVDSYYSSQSKRNPKLIAKGIYNQLMADDELMHELNVLLREMKLKQLKK